MRVVIFTHSVRSDWNHGNAHFLRGVATELQARGHEVKICEPRDAWSAINLQAEQGRAPFNDFQAIFPGLQPIRYDRGALEPLLDGVLDGAALVLVHEWNDTDLIHALGKRRRSGSFRLLFHDTHHRIVTAPEAMNAYDLSNYDGVLAFGRVLQQLYVKRGLAGRAWTWHEAADIRVFRPIEAMESLAQRGVSRAGGDLVWVGNWGDEERTEELREFLLDPVRELQLSARVYGVRYPAAAREQLRASGISYGGWIANFKVPELFSRYRVTVHVPRRPYVRDLPGIPTIRVFEALACGLPLVSAPWEDSEGLFTPGTDFLVARDGPEMRRHLKAVTSDAALARELARRGRETILKKHTCGHRVDELLAIARELGVRTEEAK